MQIQKPILRTLATVAFAAASSALVVSAAVSPAEGAGTKRVHIKGIDYSPHTLNVSKGTTVTWTFEDVNTPHTVTSRGTTKFRGSPAKQSGSYSFRFTKPGTYKYVCTIHFNMKARIVVT